MSICLFVCLIRCNKSLTELLNSRCLCLQLHNTRSTCIWLSHRPCLLIARATELEQKISSLIMRMSRRSVSDFPCSDEYKRTVSEGTRSCAEVMSLVIEDCKKTYDFIRSVRSENFRASRQAVGERTWDLTSVFFSNAPAWESAGEMTETELRGRIGEFFIVFSTCEFLFLCYISARLLTHKLQKLNKVCVI